MLQNILGSTIRFLKEEDGPTAVEYAVMLGAILLVCILTIAFLGTTTGDSFQNSGDEISGAFN